MGTTAIPEKLRMASNSNPFRDRALVAAGWSFVGLGAIGALLPVLPTTCFMIAALACFAKGSPRLAARLLDHPRYGASLKVWQAHRVIPVRIKAVAVSSMVLSLAVVTAVSTGWQVPTAVGAVLLAVSSYIITRPSLPPAITIAP